MADFAYSDLPDTEVSDDERGTLDVRTRALEHLAEHAASQVAGTVRHSGAITRLRGKEHPHADVTVEGSRAWVELQVAATWPCPVDDLLREVRQSVLSETGRLSGLDVVSVDVRLHLVDPAQAEQPHVRRVQ